jgi:hypothetical protein
VTAETYRVIIRLPIPADHMGRISDAFPGAMLQIAHDEGPGVLVLDVPTDAEVSS